ncbi:MAG TPA: tRNA pseudouridine(55) synthase TruB [Acidothermaceae bacterium]
MSPPQRGGLVVVDKPAGLTSHDVVARVRRLAGTRRVGHAGTLDPMATGVLLVGIGRATRLLGHLALHDKDYDATIRLGLTTSTDDAEGEALSYISAVGIGRDAIAAAAIHLTGPIEQRPPGVSAIKVDGKRAYARVRAGEDVVLASRRVTVSRFAIGAIREVTDAGQLFVDVDAAVTCSTGTYIRALARDIGTALGVGGHLTALRRTRVGTFDLAGAHTLSELEEDFAITPLNEVAAAAFVRRDLDADEAERLSHGGKLAPSDSSNRTAHGQETDPSLRLLPTASSLLCLRIATALRALSPSSSANAKACQPGSGSVDAGVVQRGPRISCSSCGPRPTGPIDLDARRGTLRITR